MQLHILERTLKHSEALSAELIRDKDRVMIVLRKEAPKVYRNF